VANQARVVGGADPHRVAGQLFLGQPVLVLAAGGDDGVDEGVAVVFGHAGQLVPADVVAGVGPSRPAAR